MQTTPTEIFPLNQTYYEFVHVQFTFNIPASQQMVASIQLFSYLKDDLHRNIRQKGF